MVNSGYQPRAPKQSPVPPRGESEIKTLTEGSVKGGSRVKKRPSTVEYRPKPRTQKDGVDYSLVFLAVSFFVVGVSVGANFA